MKHEIRFKRQRGFGLIEWLLVAAIIGIALAFVAPRAIRAIDEAKADGEIENIRYLSNAVIKRYSGTGQTYVNLDNAAVLAMNIVPDSMAVGGAIVNGWRGAVTFSPANHGGTNLGFDVAVANLPGQACSAMAAELANGASVVTVNDGTTSLALKAFGAAGGVDPSTAANACAADGNTVTLGFTI